MALPPAPPLMPVPPLVYGYTPPQTGPNVIALPVGYWLTSIKLRRNVGGLLGWILHPSWYVSRGYDGHRFTPAELRARQPLNLMAVAPGTFQLVFQVDDRREPYQAIFGLALPPPSYS